jgi:hypothetical protein
LAYSILLFISSDLFFTSLLGDTEGWLFTIGYLLIFVLIPYINLILFLKLTPRPFFSYNDWYTRISFKSNLPSTVSLSASSCSANWMLIYILAMHYYFTFEMLSSSIQGDSCAEWQILSLQSDRVFSYIGIGKFHYWTLTMLII